MKIILDLIQGILFGSSCLIPGFSGGTMLVIIGKYQNITQNLANLFRHPISTIKNLFFFATGTIIGIIFSTLTIYYLLEKYPFITSCFFVGLIIGTIFIVIKNLNIKTMTFIDILVYFICLTIGLYMSLFTNNLYDININQLNLFNIIYIFITAIIASAVMIIPAASGTTILLMMGLYDDIMQIINLIIKGLIKNDFHPIIDNFYFIMIFFIGIILGIVVISKLITYLLLKKPSLIWSSVLGLLVVSVISIYNDVFDNRLQTIRNVSVKMNLILGFILLIIGIIIMYLSNKKKS